MQGPCLLAKVCSQDVLLINPRVGWLALFFWFEIYLMQYTLSIAIKFGNLEHKLEALFVLGRYEFVPNVWLCLFYPCNLLMKPIPTDNLKPNLI